MVNEALFPAEADAELLEDVLGPGDGGNTGNLNRNKPPARRDADHDGDELDHRVPRHEPRPHPPEQMKIVRADLAKRPSEVPGRVQM